MRLLVLCCLFAAIVVVCAKDVQYDVLMDFYKSTNGPAWREREFWGNVTIGVCQWYGIKCDSEGNVTHLYLNDNQLSGTIPDSLGQLSILTWFLINDNNLTHVKLMKQPPALLKCDVSHNSFQCPIPDWVKSRCNGSCQ